jgi:hypothetical protein
MHSSCAKPSRIKQLYPQLTPIFHVLYKHICQFAIVITIESLLKRYFSSVASNPLVLAPKVDREILIYSLYLFPSNYKKGFNHVHLYSPSLDTSLIFLAHISTVAQKYLQHVHLIEETMMTHLPCSPHALNPLKSSSYTHNPPPNSMYFISLFANLLL